MADGDIKSVRISVTASTTDAEKKLNQLSRALESVSKAAEGLKKAADALAKFTDAIERLCHADLSNLASQIGRISGVMRGLGDTVGDAKGLNAAAKYMNAATRRDAEQRKTAQMELSKQRLALAEENARTAAAKEMRLSQAMSQAMSSGITKRTSMAGTVPNGGHNIGGTLGGLQNATRYVTGANEAWDVWDEKVYKANAALIAFNSNASRLTKVVSLMKTLASVAATTLKVLYKFSAIVGKVAFNFARLTASIATAPWRRLGSSIKDAVKRLSAFFSAVKRIAIYRAIRWALKALTQAFREGMENLYQYSVLIDGTFAKSMDMLATSALYAKNSLAAMAAPIVNVLAPAVDMLVDEFVDLLNTVNELLASLTGASTWTKALKYPKAYAEAADGANGKAKELRATLLGFDEINRLDDNKKGSRGSAADQLDYSKMFEEQTVSTKAKDYVKAIKEAFAKGDFTDIGKSIGKKIKKGLDSIDWASIESAVTRNASSVATLINGFVDVDGLGTTIGSSIASAFNVAVAKMQTFFGTVRWDKVGKFLADGINGILQTFDTAKLGQNLATIINSAVTLIHSFTSNVRWSEVGSFVAKGINNFLATIKGADIGQTIAGIINNAVQLIHGFTSSVKWSEFGKFLSDGINGFFSGINSLKLAETISLAIKNAVAFVHAFFSKTDFLAIGEKIGNTIKGLEWKEILKGLGLIIFDALKAALKLTVGLIETNPLLAAGVAAAIAYKIAAALGATTVTQTIAGAMGTSMAAGATAAGTGLAAGTSALALGIIAGLGVLASAAVFWICDKITDGQSTWQIKKALGLVMDQAEAGPKTFEESGLKNGRAISTGTTKSSVPYSTPYSYKASGGDVQTGTLFLAGEAGAEIISSASGKTTVSNRDQIAESVAIGNEEGNEILRELLSVARNISAKEFTSVAQITTGQITSALNRANVRSGSTVVPVQGG